MKDITVEREKARLVESLVAIRAITDAFRAGILPPWEIAALRERAAKHEGRKDAIRQKRLPDGSFPGENGKLTAELFDATDALDALLLEDE